MTTKKEYSKGYGDKYPNEFTSAKCIWDACEAFKTIHGVPPTGKHLKDLNLSYKDKKGQIKSVNPNNVDIELNSYKKFIESKSNKIFSEPFSPSDLNMTIPSSSPRNQILFGPPGTGKTYNTINEALRILEPSLLNQSDVTRKDLLDAFNRYTEVGQIVFCTFHQSFSYEDFVEGIRASPENGTINYSIESGIFKNLCDKAIQSTTATENPFTENPIKYVLIIDEINRGNISKVFGELITLIEPSKRAGRDEALSVRLPYSKESFSVPDNVYLIGTMNTADRSLASLDIALRRRFVFVEMLPRPDFLDGTLVSGVNIGELLRVMNKRIEVLLGREHCLGHSYFMALRENPSVEILADIFCRQILPLLQEYFFEDGQRISWVLNDQRKLNENRFLTQPKIDLLKLFGDEDGARLNSDSWHVNAAAFDRIEAYAGVIDHELKGVLLDVRREIEFDGYTITQLRNGSIRINGIEEGSVLSKLREIADQLQITMLNGKGNVCNNIELGAKIIKTIDAQNAVVAPQSARDVQV